MSHTFLNRGKIICTYLRGKPTQDPVEGSKYDASTRVQTCKFTKKKIDKTGVKACRDSHILLRLFLELAQMEKGYL